MNGQRTLQVVCGIFLFFGLVVTILVKGLNSDVTQYVDVMKKITVTQVLNNSLNEGVVRSRSFGENKDYLSLDAAQLKQTCHELEGMTGTGFLSDEKRSKQIHDYCALVDTKLQGIEVFKTKNSILKTSWHYLPLTLTQLMKTPVEDEAQILEAEILQWAFAPTDAWEKVIDKKLLHLKAASLRYPQIASLINAFYFHGDLVVKGFDECDKLQAKVTDDTIQIGALEITSDFTRDYEAAEKTSNIYRMLLLALCGALGIFVIGLIMRLVQVSDEINQLNSDLEKKVEERTHELSDALNEIENKQQILLETSKMSALGEMAGGVAHEINTPLGAILLHAEILQGMAHEIAHKPLEDGLTLIIKTVERIGRIVSGMRRFSRDSGRDAATPMPVNEAINDALALCQERFKNRGLKLEVDFISPTLRIQGVSGQISQVVLNLLNNAHDAVSDSKEPWIYISVYATSEHVQIVVTDSGEGIPVSVQKKMMMPFFTTKEVGKGTGLGLSISKGIIESHGGTLEYDSKCPNTRFIISLPRLPEQGVTAA